ncbi:MAG TPA: FAD binding domain-containing protein [Acidimicrobiales bacterium]|nr:FAD binding domain-containing protein [Acidimicrobiales bacterium]
MSTSWYRRPHAIAEALALLARPANVVLAGGTSLNARPGADEFALVDLQALGLEGIARHGDDELVIGAMTTLQQIADHEAVPPVVREAARRELPSTLRAQATLGGCVATAEYDCELLATLLAYDAVVRLATPAAESEVRLEDLFGRRPLARGEIITALSIDPRGNGAAARTGRTPADRPIVAAVVRELDGERRLALAGVAATPLLVAVAATTADGAAEVEIALHRLAPPGDFRGSSEYRSHLAAVLGARALEAVQR